ncbi:MAG: gliding motility-associated C-terminal domain-containing protein [Bacteroidetes bacterium]|nr:gliding motility-associated C-terminal domain-containing protein [Bacteroidota bacterium]
MNEVSNGTTGNQEYVEFVVVSNTVTYNCSSSTPPCIDIRGWIFDDNSGYHGTSGIASGAVRFSQNALWSCLPLGTIILIYNGADKNPAIPTPDDITLTDGNCRIIADIGNTALFDKNATTPGAGACSYPSTGWTAGGSWSNTALANSSDCARIVNLAGCEVFSVCYGAADNLNNLIYFSGTGGGNVYYFNGVDPQLQSNWSSGSAATLQTPGAPNNTANADYIAQFNNGCMPITQLSVTAVGVNAGCSCNGSATASASGSIGNYTYVWYDAGMNPIGQTAATATGLCAGVYNVIATSHIGCTATTSITISSSSSTSVAVNSQTICAGASAILTATPSAAGGAYSWTPGGLTTSSISISPGSTTSYSVLYTLAGCSASNHASVTVISLPTITVNSSTICSGQTATLTANGASTYLWNSGSTSNSLSVSPSSTSNYTVSGTTAGCTSTSVATISITPLPTVTVNSSTICSGQAATLTANGANTYTWSTGSTSNPLTVSPLSTTNYTVTGSITGCTNTAIATISIAPLPTITVNSPTICSGQTTTLTANGASTYTWSTGATTNFIFDNPISTKSYSVMGESSGCLSSATASIIISPNLSLSVNSPTICAGETTTLTSMGATTYTWSNGVLGNTIVVSPSSTSTFSLAGSNGSCTGYTTTTVVVMMSPTVSITSPPVCAGQTTTLTANGATSYTWNTGTTGNSLTVLSGSISTSYSVTGTSAGCSSNASTVTSINPSPVISVNSATICSGETVTLTAYGANTYLWDHGPLTNTIAVSPITSTIYSVSGSNGTCSTTATVSVLVNPAPVISVNSKTICAGQNATLTAYGATSYSWNNGSQANPLVISPTSSSVYTVTGMSMGCMGSQTATITVNDSPVVSFLVNDTVGCSPLCVQFTNLSTVSSGSITNWNWSFHDGTISSLQDPSHCFNRFGYYDVSLTVSSSNKCSNTLTIPHLIHVVPSPVADFTGNFNETDILNPLINFVNLSTNANSYNWSFGDNSFSHLINPSHLYLQEGIYTTTLTAINQYGCKDVAMHDIIVKGLFTFYAPNSFTPNGDHVNDVFLPLGVGWDQDKYQLDIFDRWGNNCFTTKETDKGWDGKANHGSESAQIDTYTWKVSVTDLYGEQHKYIGKVTIIK